jgi:peptide/nickel transport system substrate-binding protein
MADESDIDRPDGSGIDRRTFIRRAGALGAVGATGGLGSLFSADSARGAIDEWLATPKPQRGGTAVLATVDKPVNMDPADGQLYSSLQVYQNIFASLLDVDANFKFRPGLARSWKQEDEKTWMLELVDNAVFHNGEPFTSADVAFSVARIKKHPLAMFTAPILRAQPIGKHRARVHLSRPYGAFEATLAAIIEVVNEKGINAGDPKLKPVGCGPYKMSEWVQDDHVTLERWDKYFKSSKPYFDRVVFKAIGDDSVRLTGLMTGELDWIQRVPPQRVKELASSSEIKSSLGRPYNPDLILLNCSKPPFNDKRVRQAVAWAIDRDEISKIVWFGTAVTATEATSKPSPWYTGINPYKGGPDPDKAKKLLRQAGIKGTLNVVFAAQPQVATQLRTAQVLQSQLKKIGINMQIKSYEPAQWFQQLATKKYDITSTYFSATMDPAHIYLPVCHTGSAFNFPVFSNKHADQVMEKFAYASDQKLRRKLYRDVVRTIAEEAPIIFLSNEIQRYWTKPNIYGSVPLPSLEIRVEDMWRKS